MHIVALRKLVQNGPHIAVKDKVVEVPDAIGKQWVESKLVREATAEEVKSVTPKAAK